MLCTVTFSTFKLQRDNATGQHRFQEPAGQQETMAQGNRPRPHPGTPKPP